MDRAERIKAEVGRLIGEWRLGKSAEAKYRIEAYSELLEFIDSLPEEEQQVFYGMYGRNPQESTDEEPFFVDAAESLGVSSEEYNKVLDDCIYELPSEKDIEQTLKHIEINRGLPSAYDSKDGHTTSASSFNREKFDELVEKSPSERRMKRERKLWLNKACEWLNNFYSEDRHYFLVKEDIEAFKKAMEE